MIVCPVEGGLGVAKALRQLLVEPVVQLAQFFCFLDIQLQNAEFHFIEVANLKLKFSQVDGERCDRSCQLIHVCFEQGNIGDCKWLLERDVRR